MQPVYDDSGVQIAWWDPVSRTQVPLNQGPAQGGGPSTDEIDAEEAQRGIIEQAKQPPPGVPMSFWQKILDDPASKGDVERLLDPTRLWEQSKRFPDKGAYLKFLQDAATDQFEALPAARKKLYTEADANGNPYPPESEQGQIWTKEQTERSFLDDTLADFTGWEEGDFQNLKDVAARAAAGEQEALDDLKEIMAGIENPELREYVGDYVSQAAQAAPSQEAIDRQKAAYDKTWALTDVQETAEEKLMREMARRQQEQDLKAQRGAFANDLQARGVYGSGAELTMNLAASQEAANRRAMEEMQANANAQQRAMMALERAGVMSGQIRDAEAQESQFRGTAADRAAEFNKTLKDAYDKWLVEQQRKNNQDTINNGITLLEQTRKGGRNTVSDAYTIAGLGGQTVVSKGAARGGGAIQIGNTQGTGIAFADNDRTEKELEETLT